MARSPFPSRALLLAIAGAFGGLSGGVCASWAQAPAARAPVPLAHADPFSAAVAEASRRFGVPEPWIRSVMRVESAGNARVVSRAGAIGLMQVMPGTYAELRARYGLGPDPFAVRDNILAGTAYLREMHDRYGVQGMLAAYNAGPGRWEAYIRAGRRLPAETVSYLTRLAPEMGAATLPVTQGLQHGSVPQAPRPTLFAQVVDPSAATGAVIGQTSNEPAAVVSLAPTNSLFVPRSAAEPASRTRGSSDVGQAASTPSPAPSNPLFVPVRTAPDRP